MTTDPTTAAGYDAAIAELRAVYGRTGSPAAAWAADYLAAPTNRGRALAEVLRLEGRLRELVGDDTVDVDQAGE